MGKFESRRDAGATRVQMSETYERDRIAGLRMTQASSPAQIAQVRELFLEYAKSLGFSLCFQSFDQELAGLPGDYSPPDGRLLIAEYEG